MFRYLIKRSLSGKSKSKKKITSIIKPEFEKNDSVALKNEPILSYNAGSDELKKLEKAIKKIRDKVKKIPCIINGEKIFYGKEQFQVMPHDHRTKIAQFYHATEDMINDATRRSREAQRKWDRTPLAERVCIWETAADLMAKKYRYDLVAATMLGQGKTVVQAEIDAAAELIDFIRLNAAYLKQATQYKPLSPTPKVSINHMRLRGLEGFVAAVTPFNFTAIGGNLAYTPALMGNCVLWKPSDTAVLSNYLIYKIMQEAGVPDGVVNFIPANGPEFGNLITTAPDLAAINFTGSKATFQKLWKLVGKNLHLYRNFPRLIGECGGKNFHFVHPTADVDTVVACTVRSAFEYSGQKCSACSRLFVPDSLWDCKIKKPLIEKTCNLSVGPATEYKNFLSAVIDLPAFIRISDYIEYARRSPKCEIIAGGTYANLKGYFIKPTIVQVSDPKDRMMKVELFGPVLTVFVYKDKEIDAAMDLVRKTEYALTGAIFANDEKWLRIAVEKFKCAAGNFYINDKCTGSVVGQQPFGGGKMSGTNDKAGGPHYILRWTSPQSIKETFVPMTDIEYPYMKNTKSC